MIVKVVVKCNYVRVFGMGVSNFYCVFYCFCIGGEECGFGLFVYWGKGVDFFCQGDVVFIWYNLICGVDKLLQLLFYCCDQIRVVMFGIQYCNVCGEIDVFVVFNIFQCGVFS